MKSLRLPLIALISFLECTPLLRMVARFSLPAAPGFGVILRWAGIAAAVAGPMHGVSGATTLDSGAMPQGQVGVPYSYTTVIHSDKHGTAKAYTASGISPTPSDLTQIGLGMKVQSGVLSGTPTRAGTFRIRIKGWEKFQNGTGAGDSASFNVTWVVVDAGPALGFTSQPQPQTVVTGSPVSLTVGATGPSGFTYLWLKDGIELAGATSPTYSISSATLADEGTYTVRIRSSTTTLVSQGAFLTVNQPPQILGQPSGVTLDDGQALQLSVAVSGKPTPSVQWNWNGSPIPGAVGPVFQVASVTTANAGDYSAIVSNVAGSVQSQVATVVVRPKVVLVAPSIDSSVIPGAFHPGDRVAMSVVVSGTPPISLQWRRNGVAFGTGENSQVLLSAQGEDAGEYSVLASGPGGSVSKVVGSLNMVPVVIGAPVLLGGNFAVSVQGIPGRTYHLQRASDLATSGWVQVKDASAASGGVGDATVPVKFEIPIPSDARGFYRVQPAP